MRHNLVLLCLILTLPGVSGDGPLFDAHLHYSARDAAHYSPPQILVKLDRAKVRYAVVTGTPSSHTLKLYQYAPERIVPLLGIYRRQTDKATWSNDEGLPARIESELAAGGWRGIGELHIFAKDRHSPVFRRIVEIASRRGLPLLIHADPAVIDIVYDIAPSQSVIWAHAGTYPYPDLVADYLQRYAELRIDLSVRDERIAPGGVISDDWYELFVRFPNRFMVGVDTYSTSRWSNFESVVATTRHWLSQLPDDVAKQLAYDNAAALFKPQ